MATCQQPAHNAPVRLARHIHIAIQHSLFIANGLLDTHIHRPHHAQLRRPCRYFRQEPLAIDQMKDKSDGSILELRIVISLRH